MRLFDDIIKVEWCIVFEEDERGRWFDMHGKDKTTFIYFGDLQCDRFAGRNLDYSGFRTLLERSRKEAGCDGAPVVLSGDIVNRAEKEDEWKAFTEAAGPLDRFVTAAGNPRGKSGVREIDAFLRFSDLPESELGRLGRGFYSFDYGDIHFTVLDSNMMGCQEDGDIGVCIERDIAGTVLPVKIVVMHHPVFPVFYDKKDDDRYKRIKERYFDLFVKCGVDFILCGHQHVYCRSRDISGITQLMGISGTKFFPVWEEPADMEVYIEFKPLATVFETDGVRIGMKTIDLNGDVVDSFEKQVNR